VQGEIFVHPTIEQAPSRPLIVAHAKTKQHAALFRRLGAIDCDLRMVDRPEAGAALLNEGGADALLLPVGVEEVALLDGLNPAARKKTVALVDNATSEMVKALTGRQVAMIIVKTTLLAADDLLAGVLKLLRGDLFGIEKYLAWGTMIHRVALSESPRRGEAIDTLDVFLSGLGLDPRLVGQTLTMADEFITNAFYNAPVDRHGRRRHAHLPRIEPVRCDADRVIDLTWGCDGGRLAVGVRDSYGTLTAQNVLGQVSAALGDAPVNMQESGAGLGLVTAFQSASQLVFNVVRGKTTECIGLVDVGSYREFLGQGKSVHLFDQGERTE
jgi:hypothetical protein